MTAASLMSERLQIEEELRELRVYIQEQNKRAADLKST